MPFLTIYFPDLIIRETIVCYDILKTGFLSNLWAVIGRCFGYTRMTSLEIVLFNMARSFEKRLREYIRLSKLNRR